MLEAVLLEATRPLIAGERLTRDEFLRRWEAQPELKYADLIGGVVYLSPRVTRAHGTLHISVSHWLGDYANHTTGCEAANISTWLTAADCPQPDTLLRVLTAYGGQSSDEGQYYAGAPELAVEISDFTAAKDLGPKLELYQSAGVREYMVVLTQAPTVKWLRLGGGRYREIAPDADGIYRSTVFPGLWLDPAALLTGDWRRLRTVLLRGLRGAAHREFVAALGRRRVPQ